MLDSYEMRKALMEEVQCLGNHAAGLDFSCAWRTFR